MNEQRLARIQQLIAHRQPDVTILMEQVHKPHNLAAIIRTCDAVGIGEVHAVFPEKSLRQCGGTAMGSHRWVKTHLHSDISSGIQTIRSKGMKVFAAHFSDKAIDYKKVDYTQPCCLLVGAEKTGVSHETAEMADEHILIPMLGMVQSLNVSVAAALILYEMQRQRQEKGFYDTQKVSNEVSQQLIFEWMHKEVKVFCDKHGLRYPNLNEKAEIDDEDWQRLRQQ